MNRRNFLQLCTSTLLLPLARFDSGRKLFLRVTKFGLIYRYAKLTDAWKDYKKGDTYAINPDELKRGFNEFMAKAGKSKTNKENQVKMLAIHQAGYQEWCKSKGCIDNNIKS